MNKAVFCILLATSYFSYAPSHSTKNASLTSCAAGKSACQACQLRERIELDTLQYYCNNNLNNPLVLALLKHIYQSDNQHAMNILMHKAKTKHSHQD